MSRELASLVSALCGFYGATWTSYCSTRRSCDGAIRGGEGQEHERPCDRVVVEQRPREPQNPMSHQQHIHKFL